MGYHWFNVNNKKTGKRHFATSTRKLAEEWVARRKSPSDWEIEEIKSKGKKQ